MKNIPSDQFLEVAAAMKRAQSITVLTGAGISTESGLPTFRDAMTGLWANYRPEELASPEAYQRNPKLVWDWYAWRRGMARAAPPNEAHRALAALQRLAPKLTLVTQNVDGLHQRAGNESVTELHGSLFRVKCVVDGSVYTDWTELDDGPPHCPECGGWLRPDILWFGEPMPREALHAAVDAARECDLFLSIGTSGNVEPAASLLHVAEQYGASCAVVNLEPVASAPASAPQLLGRAGEILPALVHAVWLDVFRGP